MKFSMKFSLIFRVSKTMVRLLNKCKNRFTTGDVMKRKFSTENLESRKTNFIST